MYDKLIYRLVQEDFDIELYGKFSNDIIMVSHCIVADNYKEVSKKFKNFHLDIFVDEDSAEKALHDYATELCVAAKQKIDFKKTKDNALQTFNSLINKYES